METELQQAERIARNVMTNQFAFVADVVAVCRMFLAQQARLAERELAAADEQLLMAKEASAAAEAAEEARRRYPAPTEREAAQPSVFRTPAAFSSSIFVTEACADCEALNGNQWSVAGRVYCPKHSITLRLIPPQAEPEPLVIPVKWRNVADGTEKNASTYVRLTPADCRRIVETGRQHKENAE